MRRSTREAAQFLKNRGAFAAGDGVAHNTRNYRSSLVLVTWSYNEGGAKHAAEKTVKIGVRMLFRGGAVQVKIFGCSGVRVCEARTFVYLLALIRHRRTR